ncbi:hypothetical protein KKB99_03475 [bacterium]|nr:hypothetical protein [bacterium]MBU1025051.1 hypothetical protein [bacterium]
MIDLTFKVVAAILFIAGIVIRFFTDKEPSEGAQLMITAVFIFLLAHIISELSEIKAAMKKKE